MVKLSVFSVYKCRPDKLHFCSKFKLFLSVCVGIKISTNKPHTHFFNYCNQKSNSSSFFFFSHNVFFFFHLFQMGDYNLHQNPHPCNELGSDDRRLSTDSVSVWRRSFVMGHGDEEGSSGGRAADGWRSDGLPPLSKIGGGEMSSGGGDGRNSGRNIDPNMDPRKLKR